jgi:hypothetical protein
MIACHCTLQEGDVPAFSAPTKRLLSLSAAPYPPSPSFSQDSPTRLHGP